PTSTMESLWRKRTLRMTPVTDPLLRLYGTDCKGDRVMVRTEPTANRQYAARSRAAARMSSSSGRYSRSSGGENGIGVSRAAPRAGNDLLLDPPVQELVLAEHDRVGVADGRSEQSVGVGGGRRARDLESGMVVEPGLDVLGVVGPAADSAAVGAAHDQRYRPA